MGQRAEREPIVAKARDKEILWKATPRWYFEITQSILRWTLLRETENSLFYSNWKRKLVSYWVKFLWHRQQQNKFRSGRRRTRSFNEVALILKRSCLFPWKSLLVTGGIIGFTVRQRKSRRRKWSWSRLEEAKTQRLAPNEVCSF